jgi:hypothetical protein
MLNAYGAAVRIGGVESERERLSTSNPTLLTPNQLDNLGLAVLSLAKELWIVKDRQLIAEALLNEKGMLADLDSFQPDADLTAKLAAERQRFMQDVMTALLDPPAPKL